MRVTINNVYPWGRSFDEYRRMFRLRDADLSRRILGCADGPASFNAEMRRRGHDVVSCDPLYQFSGWEIRARIEGTYREMIDRAARERDRFVWDRVRSPEELGQIRMSAMNDFLADYQSGSGSNGYVAAALPYLPFTDGSFDLALCSHFLLLYSDELSLEMHRQSVLELCRVAGEVRIFPLLDMQGRPSPHVAPLVAELSRNNLRTSIERVDYEFQRGGNEMLTIGRPA